MNAAWAKRWDHKLIIKHIFMIGPDLPPAADTVERAKKVAEAVTLLRNRLHAEDDLYFELEEPIDALNDLAGVTNDYEARERFNEALTILYDIGDHGKRVWVD